MAIITMQMMPTISCSTRLGGAASLRNDPVIDISVPSVVASLGPIGEPLPKDYHNPVKPKTKAMGKKGAVQKLVMSWRVVAAPDLDFGGLGQERQEQRFCSIDLPGPRPV
ncbi:MAG TPA: hypothetical protein VLV85_00490, partial [Stellaceae bacterium]|nr:hypothetical protein [Stellaceae bacterium]